MYTCKKIILMFAFIFVSYTFPSERERAEIASNVTVARLVDQIIDEFSPSKYGHQGLQFIIAKLTHLTMINKEYNKKVKEYVTNHLEEIVNKLSRASLWVPSIIIPMLKGLITKEGQDKYDKYLKQEIEKSKNFWG